MFSDSFNWSLKNGIENREFYPTMFYQNRILPLNKSISANKNGNNISFRTTSNGDVENLSITPTTQPLTQVISQQQQKFLGRQIQKQYYQQLQVVSINYAVSPPTNGSTKGLLNAPGQNNCFLNCAVQVSTLIFFIL